MGAFLLCRPCMDSNPKGAEWGKVREHFAMERASRAHARRSGVPERKPHARAAK